MSCSRTISDGTVTGGTLSSTVRQGSTSSRVQLGC